MNTVLVTGSTGLIGQSLVKKLLAEGNRVIAFVRDIEKGKSLLGESENISLYKLNDITEVPAENMNANYIIHAAANTSSKAFIEDPVGIINTSVDGTRRMLELARRNPLKGFVYLSSMEVYGTPTTDMKIPEDSGTNLNTMQVRSCYPESKRLCESLCSAYISQYDVPAKVVRLTQTFGPGVRYYDERVFAEFARCVIEERDIVLRTKGETRRSYLHTDDASNAILKVMQSGNIGEVYNAANEETYCSIYEMAEIVANICAKGKIKVRIEEQDITKYGYAPTLHMNLDTTKLKSLGWNARYTLSEMFDSLIADMKRMVGKENF